MHRQHRPRREYHSARFGVGPGFDPHKLYVLRDSGTIWTVTIEFPGAPVVTVE